MFQLPESPRSVASHLSDLSCSPPKLDPSTLALLDSFFNEKAEEERRFNEIAAEQAAAKIAGLALEIGEEKAGEKPMVSVADFRFAFSEDWQLSQFWYSEAFANRLADCLHSLCTPTTKIAFVCCPTGFVAFQHKKKLEGARLLEFDQRFAVLSPSQFVPYDLNEPDVFPEVLKESFDLVVVDPPYLNEVTNRQIAKTLRQILHPTNGKLLVITSTSVEDVLSDVYVEQPLGPLKKTAIDVEHKKLANDFACWGSWDGAEKLSLEP
ncbi:unnamed protein product [Cyclocybe aegerita]|uniref:Protein-lysine N-methyltransferase EFM5 n=1 Tax=Cyclocybe aegerita TaxID=1973307 RepID=A0A8S0WWU2_CYCAE|nr:unnamed protein product [Cyclocybe aegerita]